MTRLTEGNGQNQARESLYGGKVLDLSLPFSFCFFFFVFCFFFFYLNISVKFRFTLHFRIKHVRLLDFNFFLF